jgi:hypothetical protein
MYIVTGWRSFTQKNTWFCLWYCLWTVNWAIWIEKLGLNSKRSDTVQSCLLYHFTKFVWKFSLLNSWKTCKSNISVLKILEKWNFFSVYFSFITQNNGTQTSALYTLFLYSDWTIIFNLFKGHQKVINITTCTVYMYHS